MSEKIPETFDEWDETPEAAELCTMAIGCSHFSKAAAYARAAWDAGRASRDAEVLNDDYWDQHAVQCGNCSVEILTRKGSKPNNNGLSDTHGSEDEHLCGRCAGEEMYRLMDMNDDHDFVCAERDVLRKQSADLNAELELHSTDRVNQREHVKALRDALAESRQGLVFSEFEFDDSLFRKIDAALALTEAPAKDSAGASALPPCPREWGCESSGGTSPYASEIVARWAARHYGMKLVSRTKAGEWAYEDNPLTPSAQAARAKQTEKDNRE